MCTQYSYIKLGLVCLYPINVTQSLWTHALRNLSMFTEKFAKLYELKLMAAWKPLNCVARESSFRTLKALQCIFWRICGEGGGGGMGLLIVLGH